MKKKTLIFGITSLAIAAIGLTAIPVTISLVKYRKTINISSKFMHDIKSSIEKKILEMLKPNDQIKRNDNQNKTIKYTEDEFAKKLNIIFLPSNENPNYFYASLFDKQIFNLIFNDSNLKEQNEFKVIKNIELIYVHITKGKYILEFQLSLSKDYLYKTEEIKKDYQVNKQSINIEIDTNIEYKNSNENFNEDKTFIAKKENN